MSRFWTASQADVRQTVVMDLAQAKARFDRAMSHCDAIIQVHQNHGGGKQGLRTLEPSLNRAVVVLAVASWQTAIQDLTEAALDHAVAPNTGGVGSLLRGRVRQEIGGFSTPSSLNSRSLMRLVDFDPFPLWTWMQMGGQGVGTMTVTPSLAAQMTDDWLRLRHDIAHGEPQMTVVWVLESVREAAKPWLATHVAHGQSDVINHLKGQGFSPSLRLNDAQRCVRHFRRMARLTAKGLVAVGLGPDAW